MSLTKPEAYNCLLKTLCLVPYFPLNIADHVGKENEKIGKRNNFSNPSNILLIYKIGLQIVVAKIAESKPTWNWNVLCDDDKT